MTTDDDALTNSPNEEDTPTEGAEEMAQIPAEDGSTQLVDPEDADKM